MGDGHGEERTAGCIGVVGEVVGGRYRLGGVIGLGGAAAVRRAYDLRLGRQVAVKLLCAVQPELGDLSGEVRALASFSHPNLVRLLDAELEGERPFLVMDLVDGPALSERLRHGALGTEAAVAVARDVAGALAYVHARGFVHRDVKPANILVAPDGRALLADFGIAKLVDSAAVTAPGTSLGTPAYLAPEQLDGRPVGPAADVYSLGLVLAECFTGERVFQGDVAQVMAARLAGRPGFPSTLEPGWKRLLEEMTSSEPAARPTAAALVAALTTLHVRRPSGAHHLVAAAGTLCLPPAPPSAAQPVVGTTPLVDRPRRRRGGAVSAAPDARPTAARRTAALTGGALGALLLALGLGIGVSGALGHGPSDHPLLEQRQSAALAPAVAPSGRAGMPSHRAQARRERTTPRRTGSAVVRTASAIVAPPAHHDSVGSRRAAHRRPPRAGRAGAGHPGAAPSRHGFPRQHGPGHGAGPGHLAGPGHHPRPGRPPGGPPGSGHAGPEAPQSGA